MGPGGSVRMPARSARWKLLQTHAGAMGCTPGRTPWILDFSNGYASTLGVPERPQVFPSASGGGGGGAAAAAAADAVASGGGCP